MSTEQHVTRQPTLILKKSKQGCRECKARKVKCDEVKPVCANCRRRYVRIQACDWSTEAPLRHTRRDGGAPWRLSSGETVAADPSHRRSAQLVAHPTSVTSKDAWRSLELRLMHHYTSVVSRSMPDCNGAPARDMWERIIPQHAFDSEVVLNPLLTLSALHIHAHSPGNSDIAVALRRYLGRSLVNHRQALSDSGEGLPEQLWLSAVVLSNMYWLLAHQTQPNELYELPFQAWTILQGVSLLFVRKKVYLSRLGYNWFGDEISPQIIPDEELSEAARMQLRALEEDLMRLFNAFGLAALPESIRDTYVEARDYVLYYYRAFYSGATAKILRRFIGTMAVRCRPEYRKMLETHDPLAMALMGRMMILLRALDHAWWMNGEGDYEVLERDIRGIRDLMPANFGWTMDWPDRVLNGRISLTRA
ncbi:hypothetical protein GQ53DRAFT_745972 [Thozetella sp. PMI_491]|nr:hypothetical protein GQ53DRAFT_745972 [Thozetella sp. PMI_491]